MTIIGSKKDFFAYRFFPDYNKACVSHHLRFSVLMYKKLFCHYYIICLYDQLSRYLLIIINPFEHNSESLERTRYLIHPNQALSDICLETL